MESLENMGCTFLERKWWLLWIWGRLQAPSLVQKWSVTLIHWANQSPWPRARPGPQAAVNLKMPAGHGTEAALAPCPSWLVRTSWEHLRPPWQACGCLFKKRQAAKHNEICNCPSVAQIKFFSLPMPRTFLTTVQRSILTIQGGGELSRLLCEGGEVLGDKNVYCHEGERGKTPGECQEKYL